ncbi:CD63 antigen [Pholidichthys leucotaenia]
MALEGCGKCIKYLLFFFNFIFWICGMVLIVVGAVLWKNLHTTFHVEDASASPVPIVIIVVGVVIFLISFFGCCGAWKENTCMITTFAILLSLLIIVEIAAGIAGYIFRDKVKDAVQNSLTNMFKNYNSTTTFKDSLDGIQQLLKCCGVNNSTDWTHFGSDGKTVPDSCCRNEKPGCGKTAMDKPKIIYTEGCHDAMERILKANLFWVFVAALVIAVLQIMGIVFACILIRSVRSGYDVM